MESSFFYGFSDEFVKLAVKGVSAKTFEEAMAQIKKRILAISKDRSRYGQVHYDPHRNTYILGARPATAAERAEDLNLRRIAKSIKRKKRKGPYAILHTGEKVSRKQWDRRSARKRRKREKRNDYW